MTKQELAAQELLKTLIEIRDYMKYKTLDTPSISAAHAIERYEEILGIEVPSMSETEIYPAGVSNLKLVK